MATINDIQNSFETIGTVANNGVQLAKLTQKTINNIDTLLSMYGAGISDPSWNAYMNSIVGEEGVQLTGEVYMVLLETRAKLTALGV